jgi:hypothetical protein
MDSIDSNEYSFGDNEIYNHTDMSDLPTLLEEIGFDTKNISTKYMCYEHYKQIFHFSIVLHYNVKTIFISRSIQKGYNTHNSIMLNKDTKIIDVYRFMLDLLILIDDNDLPICIFCDIQSLKNENRYHTTLLIYRPKIKTLEHFDSNGIAIYGHIEKLYEVVNMLKEQLKDLIFIDSKTINGLNQYDDHEAYARGLNVVCGISINKSFTGWCQIWSLMIYELVNKYPDMTTTDIIKCIYLNLNGTSTKNSLLKTNMIKGFYRILLGRTNKILENVNIKLTNTILKEWYPLYIKSDKKLSELMQSEMEERSIITSNIYFDYYNIGNYI